MKPYLNSENEITKNTTHRSTITGTDYQSYYLTTDIMDGLTGNIPELPIKKLNSVSSIAKYVLLWKLNQKRKTLSPFEFNQITENHFVDKAYALHSGKLVDGNISIFSI